jgi:PEP-CTERM motif
MTRRYLVLLFLITWALSPERAVAGLTLTAVAAGPGTNTLEVNLTGVPDLAAYGMDVLFQLPGVSFDGRSVSTVISGTSYTVTTTTGTLVAITLDTGGSNYLFIDNSNFFGNLNTVPGQPDELEVYLSDFGTFNSMGSGFIADINVNTSTLTGVLSASIESDSGSLQLLDSSFNPVSEYDAIQAQVAGTPPVQVTLSPQGSVPEPSTLGMAILGFGVVLHVARNSSLKRPGSASER